MQAVTTIGLDIAKSVTTRNAGPVDPEIRTIHMCHSIVEFDRDLVCGGHYGQRPYESHQQAEHMAAPTTCDVQKVLANSEPSTHGTELPLVIAGVYVCYRS